MEFYTNVEEREGNYVFIWDKKVAFSHTTINQFFRLNDWETLKYESIISEDFGVQ